jgi:CDP-paratose 2-epimerase
VYNLGGGRENSCSILEAFEMVESVSGKSMKYEYVETPRQGDHICYISDLRRLRGHYPDWRLTRSLDDILREIVTSWERRGAGG